MYLWIVHTTVLVNLFEAEPKIYKKLYIDTKLKDSNKLSKAHYQDQYCF